MGINTLEDLELLYTNAENDPDICEECMNVCDRRSGQVMIMGAGDPVEIECQFVSLDNLWHATIHINYKMFCLCKLKT